VDWNKRNLQGRTRVAASTGLTGLWAGSGRSGARSRLGPGSESRLYLCCGGPNWTGLALPSCSSSQCWELSRC